MSTPPAITGFVLAGGQSRRMGRDKALLQWHGRTLLEHMTGLLATICDPVIVVGRNGLPDEVPDLGPIGGIVTALKHTVTVFNIVVAVDLPFLTGDFLIHFKERCVVSPRSLIVCRISSGFPLCFGVRRDLVAAVGSYVASGKRSLLGWIERTDHEVVTDVDPRIFTNLNSPADYELNRFLGDDSA